MNELLQRILFLPDFPTHFDDWNEIVEMLLKWNKGIADSWLECMGQAIATDDLLPLTILLLPNYRESELLNIQQKLELLFDLAEEGIKRFVIVNLSTAIDMKLKQVHPTFKSVGNLNGLELVIKKANLLEQEQENNREVEISQLKTLFKKHQEDLLNFFWKELNIKDKLAYAIYRQQFHNTQEKWVAISEILNDIGSETELISENQQSALTKEDGLKERLANYLIITDMMFTLVRLPSHSVQKLFEVKKKWYVHQNHFQTKDAGDNQFSKEIKTILHILEPTSSYLQMAYSYFGFFSNYWYIPIYGYTRLQNDKVPIALILN